MVPRGEVSSSAQPAFENKAQINDYSNLMKRSKELVISIETSCDETAVALVECSGGLDLPRFKVIKNGVFSQIPLHREFGGVVPNIAKREHEKMLPILFSETISEADLKKASFIAVTSGPGLEPALWPGIEFAEKIGKENKIPVFATNHLKGHLYSFLLSNPKSFRKMFPSIALIASGGHTILLLVKGIEDFKKLGETRDDAAGEAFDKAARLLSLPYPGGPELEKIAKTGNPSFIDFPRPMAYQKNYDFSFSGLKTSLLYYIKGSHKGDWKEANSMIASDSPSDIPHIEDIAASFQKAVVDSLSMKCGRAVREFKAKSLILSGGVAANALLRSELEKAALKEKASFLAPEWAFNTDNAAMIAAAGYIERLSGKKRPLKANGNLSI